MNNIDATVFAYRNKVTGEVRCEYLDTAKDADLKEYDHIATINPRMYIQYHYDDQEKFALICEKMGMKGYGSLAIAAAIRQGHEQQT